MVAVALIGVVAWSAWAWKDSQQMLVEAQKAVIAARAEADAAAKAAKAAKAANAANAANAAIAKAKAMADVPADIAITEASDHIQGDNEHALSHGRVMVLVDPLPWVEALRAPTPDQAAEGQALLARHRLATELKAQWPAPPIAPFPKELHLQLLDLELEQAELVLAYNQHLLALGWSTVTTAPAPLVAALRSPSPEQRAEANAITTRHKLSVDLTARWVNPALPPAMVAELKVPERTSAELEAKFLRLAKEEMNMKSVQLAEGPWTKAVDSASAEAALASAEDLLELLKKPGISTTETTEITQNLEAVKVDAQAAIEARKVVEAKLAAEALAKENTRLNPFENRGWTIVDRVAGHGGFAKKLMDPRTGITFVLIAPGEFQMGSPAAEVEREVDEAPHTVKITHGFYLGMTEVTQAQWRKVMPTHQAPSHFLGSTLPVESVSWEDCGEFLAAAGASYRLPTEQEWEYACRAGTTTPFSVGAVITNAQANLDGRVRYGEGGLSGALNKTVAAGSLPANPWGLHEMHGNVWEWCSDWYSEDSSSTPASGEKRVLRGGSWINTPRYCRSANRFMETPSARTYVTGFRVAVDLP
jgi:formylglycine-generating enzyme required for sulfatase activity